MEVIDEDLHVETNISYWVYMCYDYGKPVYCWGSKQAMGKKTKQKNPNSVKEFKFCISF